MLLPIRTDSPLRQTPYANGVIIVLTMLAYVAQLAFNAPGVVGPEASRLGLFQSALILVPGQSGAWTYVTYAFLHSPTDLLHLAGNMLFLWVFGNAVNDKLGQWQYAVFYLAGAASAGLAHALLESAAVVGASGAVSAVTGAYIVLMPRARVTLVYFLFLIGTVEVPGLWLVGLYFVFDLITGSGALGQNNVANFAHIGGTLFGVAVCLGLLWLGWVRRDQFDMLALLDRWNRRRQFRGAVSRGYDPFDATTNFKHTKQDEPPAGGGRGKKKPAAAAATPDEVHDLRAAIGEALAEDDLPAAAEKYDALRRLDPDQTLPARGQLDLAGFYQSQDRYADSAAAFERFLAHYPRHESADEVRFMLGLTYARRLHDPAKAAEHLGQVVDRLHDPEDRALARAALAEGETQPAAR